MEMTAFFDSALLTQFHTAGTTQSPTILFKIVPLWWFANVMLCLIWVFGLPCFHGGQMSAKENVGARVCECVCVSRYSENWFSVRCELLRASTFTAHTGLWVHTLLIRHSPTVFFEISLCHSHTHAPLLQSVPQSLSLSLWCFYSNSRQAQKWEKGSSCIQNPEPIKHRLKICIEYQSGVWLCLRFSPMYRCKRI